MKVKIQDGMKFQSVNIEETLKGDCFTLRKHDKIWMCDFVDGLSTPLKYNIDLNDYMPLVNGIWINEPNEYIV